MTFLQSIILGIVQGITEFLPISSSAHLVLIPYLLNWTIPEQELFPFDVLVQLGTLSALIFYYREDLLLILKAVLKGILKGKPFADLESRVGWLTLLATIPAVLFGFFIKPLIQAAFSNPAITAVFLFITAAFLVVSEVFGKKNRDIDDLNWKDALWIGAFQALATFPGISRSGSTITGGMTRNLKRKTAGQFSFLMAVPILFGAGIWGMLDLIALPNTRNLLPVIVTGYLVAGVVGYFSISWLMKFMTSHSMLPFAGYCLLLGAGSLALLTLNPPTAAISSSTAQAHQAGVYQIGFDPELEWLLPVMNNCDQAQPQIEFIYQPYADYSAAVISVDAYLSYDLPLSGPGFAYQLGEDRLAVIVNPANSFNQTSLVLLDSIMSGRSTSWQSISEACADCFTGGSASNVAIAIWALPGNSYLGNLFEKMYLNTQLSSLAKIAPNSKTMRQMISADSAAIGFLPAGWMDSSVKALTISDEDWVVPVLPVLAASTEEPDTYLSQWLACVQKSFNR